MFFKKLKFIYHSRIKQYKLYCFHTRYTSNMTEQIANNNEIVDEIVANNDNENEKVLKTDTYTLNAVKRYRAKNAEKMKEYNKQYHQRKKAEKHQVNPYIKFTKTQLYEKIFEYERKIADLENQLKGV